MTEKLKPCPFCGVELIEKQDDMGGVWYDHPDRIPFQVGTAETNYQNAKNCILSFFTLDSAEIKRWNTRTERKT